VTSDAVDLPAGRDINALAIGEFASSLTTPDGSLTEFYHYHFTVVVGVMFIYCC